MLALQYYVKNIFTARPSFYCLTLSSLARGTSDLRERPNIVLLNPVKGSYSTSDWFIYNRHNELTKTPVSQTKSTIHLQYIITNYTTCKTLITDVPLLRGFILSPCLC